MNTHHVVALCLLLVALLGIRGAGASSTNNNNTIVFSDVGNFIKTHAVVHVSFDFDFESFRVHCDFIKKPIHNETAFLGTNHLTFKALTRTINLTCQDVDQLTDIPRAHHERYPRQIFAGVAAITSIFAIYEMSQVEKLYQQMNQQQQQEATTIRQLRHRFYDLTRAVNEMSDNWATLAKVQNNIQLEIDQEEHLRARLAHVQEFANYVDKATLGVQELHRGHLSPQLVDYQTAEQILDQLRRQGKQLDGRPIIDHPRGIYDLPVTVTVDKPFQYRVLLHVGIARETLKLTRYRPTPLVVKQGNTIVTLEVRPNKILLASNENIHQELDDADLTGCLKRGNTYVCDGPTAFHTQMRKSCLGALYTGDLEGVQSLCPIRQTNISWAAEDMNNNNVAVYFREQTSIQISCPDKPRRNLLLQGNHVIPLPANCSLTGHDLRINARVDLLMQAPVATHPAWDTEAFLEGKTTQEIRTIRTRLLQRRVDPRDDLEAMLRQDEREDISDTTIRSTLNHQLMLYVVLTITIAASIYAGGRYLWLCCQARKHSTSLK